LNQNEKVTIQGDGSNVRGFLHVTDVAKAIDLILEKGEVGEIYNIGSDDHDEYTVQEIAHRLIRLIHNTSDYEQYIEYVEDRPFNDKRYYISNAKVKALGWTIEKPFSTGLAELVELSKKA
jgi:dTDP-D-glucose 4,6-dehydratase